MICTQYITNRNECTTCITCITISKTDETLNDDSDYEGTTTDSKIRSTDKSKYIYIQTTSQPDKGKEEIIEPKKEFSLVKRIFLPINQRALNKMIRIRTERLRMHRKIC
jgi:hypothetical protein